MHLKVLGEQEQANCRISRKKEIRKSSAEIKSMILRGNELKS
jgi:hypothetical protein